jgi:rod shape determining protein RodA
MLNLKNLFQVRKIINMNKNIILFLFIIFAINITVLYSIGNGTISLLIKKQIIIFIIFIPIMFLIAITNIDFWYKISYQFYAICLILLIYAELFGHTAMGATRWIKVFGLFNIQPSEIMKLGLILSLSKYFQNTTLNNVQKNKFLFVPIILIIAPILLILKQPDLGTAVVLLSIGVCILFIAGIQFWKFAICGILVILLFPIAWKYALHDYQKKRIEIFLNPESDALGAGYNIVQSKITIGSAGVYGKGYMKGTQSKLSFLPEKQTDFIFATFVEEIGFIGGTFLILLYL